MNLETKRQPTSAPQFRRVLGLRDLVFYGIVLITPIAPVGIFGVASRISQGHVSTTIVIAMLAMMLTAFSYGRMAAIYPSSGSAYAYVGRALNAHLGFLAGWVMFLDYLIIPILNTIYVSLTFQRLVPEVPYVFWAALVAASVTALNLTGIRATARANSILLAVMSVVIGAFLLLGVLYVARRGGYGGLFSVRPFYNPASFDAHSIWTATSLAALTYIGFDGVTTLAEEARNPKRDILRAVVLVCFLIGILSTLEVYLAQLVWPDYASFANPETAFLDVSRRVGGTLLFQTMAGILIAACFGSALTGQASAARLLFGMGRDQVLPKRGFGYLSARAGTPVFNICLIGAIAFTGAMALNYELAAELLNFGAFLAFMGVNAAAVSKWRTEARRRWTDGAVPCLGFLFCLLIWIGLPTPAKIAGGLWFLVGTVYIAIRSHGFRRQLPRVDFIGNN